MWKWFDAAPVTADKIPPGRQLMRAVSDRGDAIEFYVRFRRKLRSGLTRFYCEPRDTGK